MSYADEVLHDINWGRQCPEFLHHGGGGGKVSLPALNSGLDSLSMGVVKPPGLWILVGPG